ncbi:ABC transporter permease [Candidatus Fermentibacteria bacterium]|nr:ABC transporter permease [Candidatus Fermentibacteria bacterium]
MTTDESISVEGSVLTVRGLLRAASVGALTEALSRIARGGGVVVDLSACDGMETAAAAAVFDAIRRARNTTSVEVRGASSELLQVWEMFGLRAKALESVGRPRSLRTHFEGVGADVLTAWDVVAGLLSFSRQSLEAMGRTLRYPASLRLSLALYYMEQAGVKAVPIIGVLCWLLGTVLGYQSGYQLKTFGAEIFMPDLVGYMVTWEIGPLLAAILVAGRSSSAFAAEIGTMKVRQEVDALEVMGFDVFQFLVIPKLIALILVMPVLVLIADFFGLLGGLLIGGWYLDMPASVYMSRLHLVMLPLDFYWGMLKGLVFALIIATVGCFTGTRVRGGASEVGEATTTAVVTAVFLVIVADALISLVYVRIRPGVIM